MTSEAIAAAVSAFEDVRAIRSQLFSNGYCIAPVLAWGTIPLQEGWPEIATSDLAGVK